jgi:hypothetical protein
MFSYFPLVFIFPRIDRKERMQLSINNMMAHVVISSMIVWPDTLNNLRDVSTTKQSPSRLEDALRICGDLSVSLAIPVIFR